MENVSFDKVSTIHEKMLSSCLLYGGGYYPFCMCSGPLLTGVDTSTLTDLALTHKPHDLFPVKTDAGGSRV